MFKQLLTYALAVTLVLEAPATAYAAEQQLPTVAASVQDESDEGITDIPSSSGQPDSTEVLEGSGENGVVEPEDNAGNGTGAPEDSAGNESGTPEDNAGNETGAPEDNTGNEIGTPGENAGNESDTPENNGENGIGSSEESDGSTANPSENGDGNGENSPEEIDGEEADPSEALDGGEELGETEEDVDAEETAEYVGGRVNTRESSSDIIELDYEKAVKDGIAMTAPYVSSAPVYSFTAPKAGRYLLYTDAKLSYQNNSVTKEVYLYSDPDGSYNQYAQFDDTSSNLCLATDYMQAGETVYLKTYHVTAAEDQTFTLKIAEQTTLTKVADETGMYTVALGNGCDINIRQMSYHKFYKISASMAGSSSTDSYTLNAYHKKTTDHTTYGQNSISLREEESGFTYGADMGSVYDVYYTVKNDAGQLIAFLAGTESLKTGSTDESVWIDDDSVVCEDHSITMFIEPIAENQTYCYYAPADGSEEEKSDYIYGLADRTFWGLKSGTEYTFRFCNSYDSTQVYATKTYKTTGEVISAKADYKAAISEDFQTLTLTADVSGYTGEAAYAYLNYQYTDALGNLRSSYWQYCDIEKDNNGNFTLMTMINNPAILAGDVYDIEMEVRFPNDNMTIVSENIKLEAPSACYQADDITFTCVQNNTTETVADYRVTVAGANSASSGNATIYCKPHNSANSYRDAQIAITNGEAAGSIGSLTPGISYDFVLIMGGVRKEASLDLAQTKGVTLVQVTGGTNEDNVYDIVRTFQAKALDSETTLADSYYLRLNYSPDGNNYMHMGSIQLTLDDGYQVVVYSAAMSNIWYTWLQPDTDYYLEWELAESSDGETIAAIYETIHTKPATVNLEVEKNGYNQQTFKVSMAAEDVVHMKENSRSTDWVVYMKKADEGDYHKLNNYCYFGEYNDYSYTLMLPNLEPETTYDLSLRDYNGSFEYAKTTFSTRADRRAVQVTSIDPKITMATIHCLLIRTSNDDGILHFYIREKGTETWKCVGFSWSEDAGFSFSFSGLTGNTTYEYTIGFGDDYNTNVASLEKTITGEFTTLEDQRALSDDQTEVSDKDASVKFKAYFSGNKQNMSTNMSTYTPSYILFFYKQHTNSKWTLANSKIVGEISQYCITTVSDLMRGTKYDYAIVLSDGNKVSTPDRVTKEGWKLTGEFTTPKAVAPASVSLSESKLYLNAAFPSDEGYGCQVLKVTSNPAVATKDYIWTSSDESVARVSNGKVTAVGPGTATITVTSLYSNEAGECASATCEVEVADYRVGYDNGSALFFWEGVQLSKGKLLAGSFELYQFEKYDKYEKVPAANYTISSNNTQIVSINGGNIRTGSVGTTKLIFTTGEFRSYLYWSTVADVKGFDILGLASEHSSYPAIENGKGSYILAKDITYMARGEVGPSVYGDSESYFEPSDYTWTSSNPDVAAVNDYGEIMALAAGTATITVKANPETASRDGWAVLDGKTVTFTLNVANRPDTEYTELYALANTQTTLGDVKAPDGWQWKDEDLSTQLVTNGVNTESYAFDAIYSKEGYYPCETTFDVYIANVTGMSAYDDHDQVLEIKNSSDVNADTMNLTVATNYQGTLDADEYTDYTVDIPEVNGLDIKPDILTASGSRTFAITATKAGTYTLKPIITVKDKSGNTRQLAQTSYEIIAVADKQVKSIEIKPLTDHIDGIYFDKVRKRIIIDLPSENEVGASAVKTPDQFEVEAVVKDRNGEVFATAQLIWNSSDQKVATVKASADTVQRAMVTIEGEGHAILTATAKDMAGRSAKLQIEIRNHAPRVDVAKVTVNTAYDYNNYYGQELAYYSSGKVEIVPVYDERIYSGDVAVYENDAVSTKLSAYWYSDNEWVIGSKGNIEPGTYNCELRVTVSGSGLFKARIYKYPLKVTVINKKAVIKAKALNTVNLFYTTEGSRMYLSISGTYRQNDIRNALWEDESSGTGNGFVYNGIYDCSYPYKAYSFSLDQERIDLIPKGKSYTLADTGIAKGKLKVWLYGYKDIYEVPISIKWKYKKPTIVTKEAGTTLVPSAKMNRNGFYLYNKTDKEEIYYGADVSSWDCYQEIKCDNKDVALSPLTLDYDYSSYCSYTYSGNRTSGSEKIKLTLSADHWREPLTAVHTMKMAAPTACLTESQITLNTTQMGTVTTDIYLKNNGYSLLCDDIGIEGKDEKAKKLLDDDSLVITGYGSRICVRQNRASTMRQQAIKAGIYTYQVTPYYTDAAGVHQALKALTLKVKVVNKAITAATKAKGTLNLSETYYDDEEYNYVELTPVFSNIGTGYNVEDAELVGEYSKYFTLYNYLDDYWDDEDDYPDSGYRRVKIANADKLKAEQKYKLAVKYTIQMSSGETFTVMGKTFTIKPKQTIPKVTVTNNNQTLYAAADGVGRTYTLKLSGYTYNKVTYPYYVGSVEGSLDCNKDGKPDIKVSLKSNDDDSYCYLTVKITDRDGVLTTTGAKGKTYSIPITVKLRGRDGISKDAMTTIKVTVKR